MWYMKDYDFERPDSDFPGYEAYFTEGEISDSDEFMEVDDDFLRLAFYVNLVETFHDLKEYVTLEILVGCVCTIELTSQNPRTYAPLRNRVADMS